MIIKEFIPHEEALALKELGFDEPCGAVYYGDKDISWDESGLVLEYKGSQYYAQKGWSKGLLAPLYQQAFRWFREKYNVLHTVNIDLSDNLKDKVYIYTMEDHLGSIVDRSEEYNTYKEAELACLRKLIEILNQNKEDG